MGQIEIGADTHEPQRVALYKGTVALLRAYGNIADELHEAGYSEAEITHIKKKLDDYVKLRETIRLASGETLDLKPYEADMRHLIDTYIEAKEACRISSFENIGLLDLIVQSGIGKAAAELGGSKETVAETIENNVRRKIIEEQLTNPAYYSRMSELLDEIIQRRREKALAYEEFLQEIGTLINQVVEGKADDTPKSLNTPGKRALYDNLGQSEALALEVHEAVMSTRPNDWRGFQPREQVIKAALYGILNDVDQVKAIFTIIKAQPEY